MGKKKRSKKIIALFFFLLILFLSAKAPVFPQLYKSISGIFVPVQRVIYSSWLFAVSPFTTIKNCQNSDAKIANLNEKNRELLVKAVRANDLERENKLLRQQLSIAPEKQRKYVLASVIGEKNELRIDKGENEGVRKGMAVVVGNILAGIVFDTGSNYAIIEIPSSPSFKIQGITSQTRAKGIVKGEEDKTIVFDSVLTQDSLTIGDTVETSGDEGVYPGLIIGKIIKLERKESDVFQKAVISPVLNYQTISKVFIITN